jgi:hypothetical protein
MNYIPVEYVTYEAPDGRIYEMFGGDRILLQYDGLGMPPVRYLTSRGVFQDGVTINDRRLDPRVLTFRNFERGNCRADWWCNEAELIRSVRPNRGLTSASIGKIKLYFANGEQREIGAVYQDGIQARWQGDSSLRYGDMDETVQFFAPDPIFDDTTATVLTAQAGGTPICLPFCLPACITASQIVTLFTIPYCGTWQGDKLVISLIGPLDLPTVRNVTTGLTIRLNYSVAAGEQVTITRSPNNTTVISSVNGNIIGTVNEFSDLVTFALVTSGQIAPNGVNVLEVTASNAIAGQSRIDIVYRTRHISAFAPCTGCG